VRLASMSNRSYSAPTETPAGSGSSILLFSPRAAPRKSCSRQQFAVLKQRHSQPRIPASDSLFWVALRRLRPGWKQAVILVQSETAVRWHRAGFKLYWTWLSLHRPRAGRKCITKELRELIFRMVAENPTWGAPRFTES